MNWDKSKIGSAVFATNLSKAFFEDDEDDQRFIDYINDLLNVEPYIVDVDPDIPASRFIPKITLELYNGFNDDHNLDIGFTVEVDLTDEQYDQIIADDALYSFIENEVLPAYVDWFNSQVTVNFPTTRSDDFSWLKFNGDEFYAKVYQVDGRGGYYNVSVKENSLYLINDFEVYV